MENPIAVTGWTHYDDDGPAENDLGGMGGWVQGESFEQYLHEVSPHMRAHACALRDAVVQRGLRYTGQDHQSRDDGVPLFSDGTVAQFSFRAWGDLMAAIWNTAEGTTKYGYMDFYM